MKRHPDRELSVQVDHLFRREAGKMVAVLIRIFGFKNADLVEDIVQDTFLSALRYWSFRQMPEHPEAWLMQVAKNKTLNALEKERRTASLDSSAAGRKLTGHSAAQVEHFFLEHEIKDSQLRALLACCDPEYPAKARIMLTLKTLSGFTYRELAAAFLTSEEAVKKNLYRIRRSIRERPGDLETPFKHELAERIDSVHKVLYLMFNEGYKRTSKDELINEQLCYEAMRLLTMLTDITGYKQGAGFALLALMYFNVARFEARIDADGGAVDLREQDRSKWGSAWISRGFEYLRKSRQGSEVSSYHIEAGIASLHCMAKSYEETDWDAITACYDRLVAIDDSPVVRINRAIALSNRDDPGRGLSELQEIEEDSTSSTYSYMLHAAKADICFRMKEYERARSYYRVALDLTGSGQDKTFIRRKIALCDRHNITSN